MDKLIRVCALAILLSPAVACGDSTSPGTPGADALPDTAGPGDDTADPGDVDPGDTAGPDVAPPPAELASSLVLLDEDVEMVFGISRTLAVEVPANAHSVTISIEGDQATQYALGSWIGPDGFELIYATWTSSQEGQGGLCLSCKNRIALSGGAFAALAPNNPESRVDAGFHTFTLFGVVPPVVVNGQGGCGDNICHFLDQFQCPQDCRSGPASGTVRVRVHAKVGEDGLPATGVLDLNLHFTGAQGLTAESARNDATFQGYLATMDAIYQTVGISLGTITYRDVDAAYRDIESIDGADSDLQAMFSESDGNPNAVNLFFVDSISAGAFGAFGVILGIAGGIPGPPLVQGSARSGVAIAIKPVQGMPAGVDTTMAHEVGHFLGLFHTSEQAFFPPQIHDPLPDTPDNDASYLMFNTGAGNKLSEWQGLVMRKNPFVRHPAP